MASFLLRYHGEHHLLRALVAAAEERGHIAANETGPLDFVIAVDDSSYEVGQEGHRVPIFVANPVEDSGDELWYLGDPSSWREEDDVLTPTDVVVRFGYWVEHLQAQLDDEARQRVSRDDSLRLDIEAFVILWDRVGPHLPLTSDDMRTADALVLMASEIAKVDNPPRHVLREVFQWFADKGELFANEFSKSAGKTAGAAAAIGVGIGLGGQLPKLIELTQRILAHL